jgi:hypothetical protein
MGLRDSDDRPADSLVMRCWVDPVSGWAWLTSRWLLEVQKVRDVAISWDVMSVALLNEGVTLQEPIKSKLESSWGPLRVSRAVLVECGDEAFADFVTALGRHLHVEKQKPRRELFHDVLRDRGLPVALADLDESDRLDADIRDSHRRAVELVGPDLGTPVIECGGAAFFGPVITRVPRGEEAGELWDAVRVLLRFPQVVEIKRGRELRSEIDG